MRCSVDLPIRVLDFINSGASKSEAARRFKVSRSSIYTWLQSQDAFSYRRPGPSQPRNLDLQALRSHVQAHPDKTQAERAADFGVSRHCIGYNLRKLKISRKKNDLLRAARPSQKKTISLSS